MKDSRGVDRHRSDEGTSLLAPGGLTDLPHRGLALLAPASPDSAGAVAAGAEALMMSQRTLRWTTTQTPATAVGAALQRDVKHCPSLEIGIPVVKVTSRGKLRTRVLTLSKDRLALFCTHYPLQKGQGVLSTFANRLKLPLVSRKGIAIFSGGATSSSSSSHRLRDRYVRYIDVADMDAIETSVLSTIKLESARRENRLRGFESSLDRRRSHIVSIHHHGNESLDVLVPDDQFRDELVTTLRQLRSSYVRAKLSVSREALLLRYIWYDVDANRDGTIGELEFANILRRINCYVANPKWAYREFVQKRHQVAPPPPPPSGSAALGRASDASSDAKKKVPGLSYADVMTLLQQIKNSSNTGSGGGRSMANLLWDDLFGANVEKVDATEFMKVFVHGCQGETTRSRSDVHELLSTINSVEYNHHDPIDLEDASSEIGRTGFEIWLFHELNDAYDPTRLDANDAEVALDKPLPRYWVNTSHNTYLTGDQLASTSSVQSYMRALRRGCKCLELDVWEGDMGSDGIPIPVVYHGHTVTSKILFVDILRGVASYLSDHPYTYPIILSLENHCSHPYQAVMAKLLQDVLGQWLYIPTERDTDVELPSPEALRGKVVIKGKRPPEAEDAVPASALAAAAGAAPPEVADDDDPYEANTAPSGAPSSQADVAAAPAPASASKPSKIVNELARLTLFHGTKYKDFEKSLDEPRSHMHSIGETKIAKILGGSAANTPLWRLYNVHHMTRTYPAGARVDSSNYNPLLAWSVGCQLVALNFQTCDTPLLVNDGMFRQYNNCGYVLKPPSVLGKSEGGTAPDELVSTLSAGRPADVLDDIMDRFEDLACGDASTRHLLSKMETDAILRARLEAKERSLKESSKPYFLRIRVLSGSCLPKPRGAKFGETIDPYVETAVHDVVRGKDAKATYSCTSNMTKAVNDNGFCPVWNEASFHEYSISSPDVAQVQFTLYESDIGRDDKVACATIPFSCLRSGYRSIQLYDMNNTRTGPFGMACLLVEIKYGRASSSEGGVAA